MQAIFSCLFHRMPGLLLGQQRLACAWLPGDHRFMHTCPPTLAAPPPLVRPTCQGLGQQRLARAWVPLKEHALGRPRAQLAKGLGVLQELRAGGGQVEGEGESG